ncbi:MAG: phosphoadenosine phosphosulfate reductase family protein [Candidatus Methanoplasma sp.]|nr:phosphoadenosine phosphosulfate reductase family protein [Candidatus Methanoplasma sp.]
MWAEANNYYYRGTLVARLRGGNIYDAPLIIPVGEDGKSVMPEPGGMSLRPVDISAMADANREFLAVIEQTTVKKIVAAYAKYRGKLDCFHVAFSGGKDSCVLLDLVKKALPKDSFVVVFGDTGMEFPDTYDVVEQTGLQCTKEGIPFYTAKSHIDPKDSWVLFGPPSRAIRWCCSVHKSTPQTLKMREITRKYDYTGLAFVGVRGSESSSRSKYEYECYGKKQRGQYSYNPLLEWTSAEIWLYIYANNIPLNEAYKKGSARVGCICCPMGGGKASFIERTNYPQETEVFLSRICNSNARVTISDKKYVANGGWNARKNGKFLKGNTPAYSESVKAGKIVIEIVSPKTDWREWIKALGDISNCGDEYAIIFEGSTYHFSCTASKNGYIIKLDEMSAKSNPHFGKLFRYVFRKAAHCTECKTCQALCKFDCLGFDDGLKIKNCRHCFECYSMNAGCYAYDSLKIPKGENEKMKSINCYSNHAPKTDWFDGFFEHPQKYLADNSLGPDQKTKFKRFLKDAELVIKSKDTKEERITEFAELGTSKRWKTDSFLALMLTNLVANSPQIEWYTKNLDSENQYGRSIVEDMLSAEDQSEGNITSIISAYRRLAKTPLGTSLHWGRVTDDDHLIRTKCSISDHRVVLYALFKFAEKCKDYKEFTLSTLLNDSIARDGVSPTRIFGLGREEMTPTLLGLSAKYPDFITASFTHDLEKISLSKDKSSKDVLDMFKDV